MPTTPFSLRELTCPFRHQIPAQLHVVVTTLIPSARPLHLTRTLLRKLSTPRGLVVARYCESAPLCLHSRDDGARGPLNGEQLLPCPDVVHNDNPVVPSAGHPVTVVRHTVHRPLCGRRGYGTAARGISTVDMHGQVHPVHTRSVRQGRPLS